MLVEPFAPLFGLPEAVCDRARHLTVERIPIKEAARLNERWHSVLPDIATGLRIHDDARRAYAATFDNGIYGVAVWTRPIAANRMAHPTPHLLELRRLAIPDYAPKFTATRMLGQMRRLIQKELPEVCRLISYQATDVHSGTIYKAANWTATNRQEKYAGWDHRGEGRRVGQNQSEKVRWELQVRDCDE